MLPVLPALPKPPPVVRVDRNSSLPDKPVLLASASTTVSLSVPLAEESLMTFQPTQPRFFVGRKEQLEKLYKLLQAKEVVVIIPEEEIPCKIGKSAMASQYAKGSAPVLWIPARNRQALNACFVKLAQQFKVEPSKVKDYLSLQNQLIVFDGAQDPELLKEYIPQGQCQVIITSRQREWPFHQIEIGTLSPEEAVDFLCQLTHQNDRIAAKKISEALDCLPTSLERAAQLIVEHQAELTGYEGVMNGILDRYNQSLKERSNLGERNRNFTGREMGLIALEEALKANSRAVITAKRRVAAEVGMGGVGKTQIALQYAFRNADKYPGVIWRVNCESNVALQESYEVLAEKLGIILTKEEKKQENALIKKVNRRLEKETGWLLIYDNVENQKALEGLIPQTGGHVLITSRSPDWDIGFAHVFKIGVFKRKESIALIQKMAPLINETDANQLAELVQDLPIAVAQAAAYIRETRIPYAEYARIFKEKSKQLLPAQEPTDEYSKTVNVTWQISIEKIQEEEWKHAKALSAPCVAIDLMTFCAFLGSHNIPRNELLLLWIEKVYRRGSSSLEDLNRTLELLNCFSLVDLTPSGVSIHTLVQLVTKNKLEEPKRKETCAKIVKFFLETFKYDDQNPLRMRKNRTLISHAQQLAVNALELKTEGIDAVNLNRSVADHLQYHGSYYEVQRYLNYCIDRCTHLRLTEGVAICKNSLGVILMKIGETTRAQDCFKQALSLEREINPTLLADILVNYGSLFINLRHSELARAQFLRALQIYKGMKPVDFSAIGDVHKSLGLIAQDLGDGDQVLEEYKAAQESYEKAYPVQDHPKKADNLHNLGYLLHFLGRDGMAKVILDDALSMKLRLYDPEHPSIADTRDTLGLTLSSLGLFSEAIAQSKKALSTFKTIYLPTHPHIAETTSNLGLVYFKSGKNKEAKEKFKEALELKKQNLSSNYVSLANTYNNLGLAFQNEGNVIEAKRHFQQALAYYKKVYPPNHPSIIGTQKNYHKCM